MTAESTDNVYALREDDARADDDWLGLMADAEQAQQGRGARQVVDVAEMYPTIDWAELWSKKDAPVDWLCEPLLIAGNSIALFSQAKEGKSLLALEIMAALATGRPVLGNPARKPIDVLYVDFENSEDDLRERLTDLGYGPDDDLSRLHYLSFPGLPALDSAQGGAHLRAVTEYHDAKVVTIDTLGRGIDGDEDKSDTYRALYRHAIMPLKAAGRATMRLDHGGKDLTRGQRGSSGKNEDVDAVWKLTTRPGGHVDLARTHVRHSHGADAVHLVRLKNPLRHALTGQDVTAADIEEVIALLDQLDIPIDWGRDRVRPRLIEVGQGRGTDLLALAIKKRKERFDLSRTGVQADDAQQTLPVGQGSEGTGR